MSKRKITSKSPAQLTWFKNVAKSLGYTSTELVQQMTPSIGEFIKTNVDYGKELAADIRDMRSSGKNRFKNAFSANTEINLAKNALKNALEDIKSGKIYNKERQDAIHDEGVEFDFGDSDFGMDNFEFDGENEKAPTSRIPNITVKTVQPPITRNSPIVKVMEQQTNAIIKSAQATNDVNMALATNKMILDHKNHTRTLQGLQSINDNLSLLVNFHSDSMAKYIGASLKYYEDSLKTLSDTLTEIKRTNGSLAPQVQPRQFDDPMNSIFLSEGGLNFKGYMAMVKKNLKTQYEQNPMLAPLKMMFEDTETLKYLAASPLSFISTKIVSAIVPQFLKQSMENLDKSFSNFFPALFMRINRAGMDGNPFMQLIKDIFGIDTRVRSSVDLSKYNKGPIPFDGQTKKAITEVIPGYLRKILVALTGKEEIAYDYEEGKFKTVSSMREDYERSRNRAALSAYDQALMDIRRRSDAFIFQSEKDRKTFQEGIEKFFVRLSEKDHLVNPRLRKNNDGTVRDELSEVYNFENDPGMVKLFRQTLLTLPKSQQMAIFGNNVLNARRNLRELMDAMEKDPTKYNAATLFNNLGFDEHLTKGKTGSFEVKKGFGVLNQVDKFNLSAVDYLRDIKRILLQGIRVFSTGGRGGGDAGRIIIANHRKSLEEMQEQQDKLRTRNENANRIRFDEYSQDEIDRLRGSGRYVLNSSIDLNSMSEREIADILRARDDIRDPRSRDNQRSSVLQWMGKFFKGDRQEKFNLLREKIEDILKKPAQLLQSVFDKIDNTMYTMVFGSNSEDEDTSFFAKTMAMMRERFRKFGDWMQTKILDPIHESLFGKQGIITRIKDSQFYKSLTERMKSISNFMFGREGADGKRQGGLLSDTANQLMDMWDGAKYYFTGKAYTNRAGVSFAQNDNSVFGEMKRMFSSFKGTMKQYLFGDQKSDDPDQKKGVLTSAIAGIKRGFQNFSVALFGPKSIRSSDANESFQEMTKKIREHAPKALAWGMLGGASGLLLGGKLGLLGSLLLPGGPIGGAIVGTTLGFLSQSDRFKNWLFGEKDSNGDRVGGVISKSTQDFLKKHRVAIIGGATVGVAKSMLTSFGLLPSFFLPGGPIAGAVLGIGASMLFRSEEFKNFMFGEKDALTGKRAGGIIQKAFGDNVGFKKLAGNVGAGAIGGAGFGLVASKLGILGAMLVPGGPIGGAILGAAAGIALTSDRWRKAIFGEWDEKTGLRKGGMLGKFTNWFKLEVQEPLKLKFQEINLNMKEWFTKSVANPFRDALAPIKTEFKAMTDNLKNMFKTGWENFKTKIGEVFEKNVGVPFGKFMEEKVMKPLRGFLSRLLNGIGKIFGSVLSSPFKAMNMMAQGFRKNQEERGLRKHIDDGWSDMTDFKGRRQRGERLGLFNTRDAQGNRIGKGIFGRFYDMYFNSEARDDARYGEHGASYARAEDERIAKRNAEQDAKFAAEREKLAKKEQELNLRRKLGMKYDYENFDQSGKSVAVAYKTAPTAGVSNGKRDLNFLGSNFKSLYGFSLNDVFGPGFNIEHLASEEKTKLFDLLNRGITGNKLKSKIATTFGDKIARKQGNFTFAGSVASSVPTSEQSVTTTIRNMSQEVTTAVKEESIKDEVKRHVVPALNRMVEFLGKATGVIRFKRNVKPKGSVSETSGVATSADGSVNMDAEESAQFRTGSYEDHLSRTGGSGSGKGGGSLLAQIARDVRNIAKEVHGQLDGVGSNVFKIRKLIQGSMGIADGDLTGSANRDRVSLWGKIRRALYHPFDAIRNKLAQGVRFVTDKIKAFGDGIVNVSKAIISVPVNIAKTMWSFTKEVGKVIKTSVLEIIKLPGKLLSMAGDALKITVQSLKMVGPAIAESLKGAAKIFSGAMGMAAHAMIGFGKGVGEFFKEAGAGVGLILKNLGSSAAKLMGTVGKFLGDALGAVTDFTLKTTHTILDFTLNTVKTVGEKLLDVGNSLMQIVASPLKFFAQSLGKLAGFRQEVIVTGGHLDSIGVVNQLGGKTSANSALNPIHVVISGAGGGGRGVARVAGANALSDAMFHALNRFDNEDEKEEKAKKTRAHVSRKTAQYQLDILNANAEKKFTRDNELEQTSLLRKIAQSTTEHKDGWMSVFGPKGLLTTGLLLLLPIAKELLSWLMGQGNNSRMMSDGSFITNSDLAEHVTKGVTTTANHVVNKKLIPSAKALSAEAHTIKGVAQHAGNAIKKIAPAIKNSPVVQKVTNSKTVKTAVTDAKIVGLMAKDKAAEALKFIKDVLTKLFTNNEIVKRIGKSAAGKTLTDILGKVGQAFAKPEIVQKYLPRISTQSAIKAGAAAFSLGTSELVWGAWNISTGFVEAHHLFKVNPDAVDWKMRVISSIIKAILGFGFNFLIAILNDILIEVFGIDFVQMVANMMYRYMSDDEDYNKLLANQENFKLQVEDYNRANGTNLSVDAYNDMMNKTVGQKMWDGIKSGAKDVGRGASWLGGKIADGAKWVGGKIADGAKATWEGAKWLGGKVVDGAKWAGGKIADGAKWVGGKIADGAQWLYNKTPFGAMTNDDIVKKNFGVTGNGTITTGMRLSSGAASIAETFTGGLLDAQTTTKYIYGAGLKAQEFWKTVTDSFDKQLVSPMGKWWENVSKAVSTKFDELKTKLSDTWDAVKSAVMEKVDAIKKKASEIWEGISTTVSDTWGSVKETVGNFVNNIIESTKEKWDEITAPIADGWTSMKEKIGISVSNLVSDSRKKWEDIGKPISDAWGNIKKLIGDQTKSITDGTKKVWGSITGFIDEAWQGVKKAAREGAEQAKTFFNNMIESVTSPFTTFFEDLKKRANEQLTSLGFSSGGPQESIYDFKGGAAAASMATSQSLLPQMMFSGYKITSGYGVRKDPISGSTSMHRGIDLVKAHRAPIQSFTNGQVVFAGTGGPGSGYNNLGNVVAICDENGFTHVYGHLLQANMRVGQVVRTGDIVGLQGSTGRSTGSHLHYEVRRAGYGTDVNPATYLQKYKTGAKDFNSLASASPTSATDPDPDPSILELFGKMAENFSLYVDNVYQGTNNKLSWGSKLATGATSTDSGALISFIPKTLQEKIIKKTAELTIGSESGGRYTYGRNDQTPDGTPLSPSIGILQWRGNNAQQIMQRMYQQLPNDPDARYFATQVNWNDRRPWSSSEQQRLENFLTRNQALTKRVQDEFAISYVRDTNLGPVYKYGVNTGKIKDPRSIAFLGEIANTGPAHMQSFLQSYTPTTGPEFPHLYQEFMRKSYWGQKSIYANRLRNTYNALANWNPEGTTSGMGGPEETISDAVANRIMENLQGTGKARASRGRTPSLIGLSADETSTKAISDHLEVNSRETAELLRQAIAFLKSIAKNTETTSTGVKDLSETIRSSESKKEEKADANVVVVDGGQQMNFNANPMLGAINSPNQKHQNDYRTAKTIAGGRTK